MKRRTFCALAGSGLLLSALPFPLRGMALEQPDLVAVQGGDANSRLDKALSEFGGIAAFVRPGQTVVIKPNMAWAVSPAGGANTDPGLVRRLVDICFQAGAKQVTCFDNTCDHWREAYRESGIEAAVRDAGGLVAPANSEKYFHRVELPSGVTLRTAQVHEAWMEADVIFNVPVLKHHSGTGLTAAMKNLMGAVWDRRFYHRSGLDQCIADFATFSKKPTLNIIDAGRVMLNGGPRGRLNSQFKRLDMLIASPDIVAADIAASLSFGGKPGDFSYIEKGAALGAGKGSLDGLDVRRLKI